MPDASTRSTLHSSCTVVRFEHQVAQRDSMVLYSSRSNSDLSSRRMRYCSTSRSTVALWEPLVPALDDCSGPDTRSRGKGRLVPRVGCFSLFPPTHPLNNSERDIQHIGIIFTFKRNLLSLKIKLIIIKIMTSNIEKVPNHESSLLVLVVCSTSKPHLWINFP